MGLGQWVKGCGIAVAAAWIRSLAWELPRDALAMKKRKKERERERGRERRKERKDGGRKEGKKDRRTQEGREKEEHGTQSGA